MRAGVIIAELNKVPVSPAPGSEIAEASALPAAGHYVLCKSYSVLTTIAISQHAREESVSSSPRLLFSMPPKRQTNARRIKPKPEGGSNVHQQPQRMPAPTVRFLPTVHA